MMTREEQKAALNATQGSGGEKTAVPKNSAGGSRNKMVALSAVAVAAVVIGAAVFWLKPAPSEGKPETTPPIEVTEDATVLAGVPIVAMPSVPEPTPTMSPEPTTQSTGEPTSSPTPSPTVQPTAIITQTPRPTTKSTSTPKPKPTPRPTPDPTVQPTREPTPEATPTIIAVTGLSISQGNAVMDVGGSLRLRAEVTPGNATDQSVSWSSSNSGVASVSAGVVSARGAGTATITASCGGYSVSCAVSVS